jgi:hypothetical protein
MIVVIWWISHLNKLDWNLELSMCLYECHLARSFQGLGSLVLFLLLLIPI